MVAGKHQSGRSFDSGRRGSLPSGDVNGDLVEPRQCAGWAQDVVGSSTHSGGSRDVGIRQAGQGIRQPRHGSSVARIVESNRASSDHEQRLIGSCRPRLIDAPEQVAVATSHVVGGHDAESDFVAHHDRCQALPSDGVDRQPRLVVYVLVLVVRGGSRCRPTS